MIAANQSALPERHSWRSLQTIRILCSVQMSHEAQNRRAWDQLVEQQQRHTKPARDDDFAEPLTAVNADGWLGENIAGKRVLCLAAGGGRQSALYAAAGATVTVVDLSPAMLALDRE